MRFPSPFSSFVALSIFGWAALSARPAAAQSSCSSNSECVKGWVCEVTGGSGCATAACAPGQTCPPAPDCAPQEFKSCVPGPCQADRDCADGMVCFTSTETNCAPTACPPNVANCEPTPCEPTTVRACVPRYVLPCTTATDCGSGFDCVQDSQGCACPGSVGSGSGGGTDSSAPAPPPASEPGPAPAADAGVAPAVDAGPTPVDPTGGCTCAPATTRHCSVLPVDCRNTADCASGWTCEVVSSASDCATTSPTPKGGPGGVAADGGTSTPLPDPCAPSADVKRCLPPYAALVGSSSGSLGVGVAEDGSSTAGGSKAGTGGTVPGTPGAAVPPADPASANAGPASSTAGCALGGGAKSGAGAGGLLLALGLVGALRRRRASR